MDRISLSALSRSAVGKNAVKKVRRDGLVPAVLYGRGREPIPLSVGRKDLLGALATGRNVLIDLRIAQNGEERADIVMVTEVQRDHLRRDVLHVDLHRISMTEALEVDVPVVLVGTPQGVAAGGGVLEIHLRELTVRCLPTQIPDRITVNVESLGVGASLHARDIRVAEGIEVVTPPERVLAAVVAAVEEAEAPAAAAAGEAEAQPELVSRPAPAEGEAAPAAEAKPAKPDRSEKKE
jgi:large subunit ribosomal protein L25